MATLREYFETDFSRVLRVDREILLRGPGIEELVPLRLHYDFDANAVFVSCFLAEPLWVLSASPVIISNTTQALAERDELHIKIGHPGSDEDSMLDSRTLVFANRIFLYVPAILETALKEIISAQFRESGMSVVIRDTLYQQQRETWQRPTAFISHDSRDKPLIAKPIAIGLMKRACPVWYDEYTLKVGDRLRESIETGLKTCQRCILIISSNFLENTGWTKTEFDSIFTREILERNDVLLPIWHGVTPKDVYD